MSDAGLDNVDIQAVDERQSQPVSEPATALIRDVVSSAKEVERTEYGDGLPLEQRIGPQIAGLRRGRGW